jgi:two-component system heavy metal sensor histidine kinase CusS
MKMPGLTRSLLFRLTLLFSLTAIIFLITLGMALTRSIDLHFIEQDVEILHHRITVLEKDLTEISTEHELRPQLNRIISKHGVSAIVLAPGDKVWLTSPDIEVPDDISALADKGMEPLQWDSDTRRYRGLRAALNTGHRDLPEGNIIIAVEISHHTDFLAYFRHTLWTFVIMAVLGICVFEWIAVRMALSPLRHIISSTSNVSADKLNLRLPVETLPYEVKQLAQSLNIMLARLEESFKKLSDFSSDIAHELRTPLSTMKIQTQVALLNRRTVDEYKNVLQSNVEELNRLSRMVNDMLFLAKSENGLETPHDEAVDLVEEVQSLFEFYEALAEASEIGMTLEGQARLTGDRLMLRRALSNLLANAIAYSTAGTLVRVVLEKFGAGHVRIAIISQGDTIAPEHLPRLFDRFYRTDGARHRETEGVGLGLAITRSIIQAHGGNIAAYSEHGATRFTVVLPKSL